MIITIEGEDNNAMQAAKTLCKGKETAIVTEYDLKNQFWTEVVNKETEIVKVTNVENYSKTLLMLNNGEIEINKKGKKPFKMRIHTIIIIKKENTQKIWRQ